MRQVRDYLPTDESSWLRCRVLAFLSTAYFDDVLRARPGIDPPGFGLVATAPDGTVTGVLDISVDNEQASIDTVAVHPDHQHNGTGHALLTQARTRLRAMDVRTLDAWTRDDPDTLRWYRAMGFVEGDHYLHVYANHYTDAAEPGRAVDRAGPGLRPIMAFLHADLKDEQAMRERFTRVHVCRRFTLEP